MVGFPGSNSSKNASYTRPLNKKPSVMSSIGKFVPPPVSPIVMAKNEKATSNSASGTSGPSKSSASSNATSTTSIATASITPNTSASTTAATTTGWRRPSISSTEASFSSAPSASLPQRKVPTLFPEITALEAKLLAPIPEPFADFPRLPGMKPVPPMPKKLSLISDEASWLDGDEVDYSQQLFTDSVGLRSERSEMEQKSMTGDCVIEKRMIEECVIANSMTGDCVIEKRMIGNVRDYTEQLKQPALSVDSASQSPRKIVILKRPKEVVIVPKAVAPKVETKQVQEPIAPVVRSFKTAKAREKESKQHEEVKKSSTKESKDSLEQSQQPQLQSKPVQKKIVYSSKEKTKIIIEK